MGNNGFWVVAALPPLIREPLIRQVTPGFYIPGFLRLDALPFAIDHFFREFLIEAIVNGRAEIRHRRPPIEGLIALPNVLRGTALSPWGASWLRGGS